MLAEWSAECSAEDPVLVVPWDRDPAHPEIGNFVDLREHPYDLDHVAEAEQHAPLLQALRALNAPRSPVYSAKCDVWELDAEELQAFRLDLDLPAEQAPHGLASYIDLLWRERTIFVSFHQQQQLLTRLARLADAIDDPYAAVQCTLRPALVDLDQRQPQEGFAFSLYIKAMGTDPAHAYENWSRALGAVTALLRGREFSGG